MSTEAQVFGSAVLSVSPNVPHKELAYNNSSIFSGRCRRIC